jgi:molybdate transport system substrate-binding protein
MSFTPNYFLIGAALVAACALTMPVTAAEIKIISTPAASTALRMAARDFERATGYTVVIEFSNIATTRKRVNAGEDFDMLVVSPKAIDDLTREGKVAAGASLNLGRTGLAIVGHKGSTRPDISTVESFKRTLLNARLFAYSATGESGIGFIKVIDKLGITDAMKPRIRASSNMSALVESGEAEIGITGVGAGLSYTQLEYLGPLPAAVQEYVYLAAGVGAHAKSPEAARALLKYLGDPAVVKAMSEKGLEPPAGK